MRKEQPESGNKGRLRRFAQRRLKSRRDGGGTLIGGAVGGGIYNLLFGS